LFCRGNAAELAAAPPLLPLHLESAFLVVKTNEQTLADLCGLVARLRSTILETSGKHKAPLEG
jgi:hypothetical protein